MRYQPTGDKTVTSTLTERPMLASPYGSMLMNLDPTDHWNDIVQKAGFDYEVVKSETPQQTIAPDGTVVTFPHDFGMLALHNGVYHPIGNSGTVGRRYEPLPMPGDALDALIREGLLIPDQAGRWGYATQFVSFLLPEGFRIDGDPSVRRVTYVGPHDGTGAWRMKGHEERWMCQNQRPIIVGRSGSLLAFRHSQSAAQQMKHIHSLITEMIQAFDRDAEMMEELYGTDLSADRVEDFVRVMAPDPKHLLLKPQHALVRGEARAQNALIAKRRGIRERILLSPTMNNLREPSLTPTRIPAVTLLHGFVEWMDHDSPVRGAKDEQARRGQRILMGLDLADKKKAQDVVLDFIRA
jgi:Domain of unknown function (DUF932)